MSTSNFAIFPHDTLQDPSVNPGLYGGLYSGHGSFISGSLDNYRFRLRIEAAGGLYARVQAWTLNGFLQYSQGSTYQEGTLSVVLEAVDYSNAVITEEKDLCKCCGWLGEVEELSGWVDQDANPLSPGPYVRCLFGSDVPVVETIAGVRMATIGGNTGGGPDLVFLGDGVMNGVIFGQNVSNSDNCPVTATLPSTHLGTFDGTGETGFTLQLGTIVGGEQVNGTITLTPTSFWPYDPEDGGGPLYNTSTGAWLRSLLDGPLDPKWRRIYPAL